MAENDLRDPSLPSPGEKLVKTIGLWLAGAVSALVVSDAVNPNGLIRSGVRSLDKQIRIFNGTNARLSIVVRAPNDAPHDYLKAVLDPGAAQAARNPDGSSAFLLQIESEPESAAYKLTAPNQYKIVRNSGTGLISVQIA